jgi:hypothetical protein
MKTKQEELQTEVMAMGQSMYQWGEGGAPPPPGGGDAGPGGPPPPGGGAPDDVIDAEFSSDK